MDSVAKCYEAVRIGGNNHGKPYKLVMSRFLECCYELPEPVLKNGFMTMIGAERYELQSYVFGNRRFLFYVLDSLRPYSKRTIAKVKKFIKE